MPNTADDKKIFLGISVPSKYLFWLASCFFLVGILSRVIPHLPDSTAALFSSLVIGFFLPRVYSLGLIITMTVVSDVLLSYLYGYPILGLWSIFTYSGYLGVLLFGSFVQNLTKLRSLLYLLSASLLFWIWTNFGVWLVSGLYTKTFPGLITCYIAALPFLRNSLLGDLVWVGSLIAITSYSAIQIKLTMRPVIGSRRKE